MSARLLVTDAGTGGTNNLIRSLRAADPSFFIVGCHADQFLLKKSSADRNCVVPLASHPRFAAAVRRAVDTFQIDLIVPNSDSAVLALAEARRRLSGRVFLPASTAVRRCQDKYALTTYLQERDVPVPRTLRVTGLDGVGHLFRRLGSRGPVWCRIRRGSGSLGAAPVRSAAQARSWIRYWTEMRGVPASAFTLAEYLPGRDFACQSLWKDGGLVLVKTCERLSYFDGGSQPSGRSSIARLAKTVDDPRVVDVAVRAVRALGTRVTGAFSVDLKENAHGVPCVTEINAGRFITLMNLLDMTGKHNMAGTYVRLALGQPLSIGDAYDVAPDHYFVRDVDTVPLIFHADRFFDDIEDLRVGA